ncbi:MAG: hypothetical protein U0894_05895 [Pirellulales bacterium]
MAWQAAQKKFAPPWLQPMVDQWTSSGIVVSNCPGQELDTNHELAAAPLKSAELTTLFPALVGRTDWHGFELVPGGTAGEFHFSSTSIRLNQSDSTTYFLAGTTGEFTTVVSLNGGRFPATPIDISYSEPINVQQLRIVWEREIPISLARVRQSYFHYPPGFMSVEISGTSDCSWNSLQSLTKKQLLFLCMFLQIAISVRNFWFQHYPGIESGH